jgi:hypothetical protein
VFQIGILCGCRAQVLGSGRASTLIDGKPSNGLLTVVASICQSCSSENSFINIAYRDNQNPDNSFSFTSTDVDFPICKPLAEDAVSMNVSANGRAVGSIFHGDATLSNIKFLELSTGEIIQEVTLTVNRHHFQQIRRIRVVLVDINTC